jgi:hypothetical protein
VHRQGNHRTGGDLIASAIAIASASASAMMMMTTTASGGDSIAMMIGLAGVKVDPRNHRRSWNVDI